MTRLPVLRARLKAYRAASRTGRRSTIRRLTAPSSPIILPGIVVGPAGGDPHDVQIELAAEIGRHAGNRVDRPVDDRQVEPPPQDRVGALLGRGRRMLERNPGRGDRFDRLVIDRLAARPAVFEAEIDLHEIESDRQRLGQPMDRPATAPGRCRRPRVPSLGRWDA